MRITVVWYADLSECDYFGPAAAPILRAVGWLERGYPFAIGDPDEAVYHRLCELLRDPWAPGAFAGVHKCDLCRYTPEAQGSRNLFIPGRAFLYVCPELITHYMNAHGYAPPRGFCNAALACPDTREEYLRALLANGGRVLVGALRGNQPP